MEQIVDLEKNQEFQSLNVALVSIANDSQQQLAQGAFDFGVRSVPLLTDNGLTVSENYDVLKWAVPSGEPGHTFILVDTDGSIAWIRDYGAPENGGVMYVPVEEITSQVRAGLSE